MIRRLLLAAALAAPHTLAAGDIDVDGIVLARGGVTQSQPPWTSGGFGRLTEGGDSPGNRDTSFRGQAHLALDWKPSQTLLVHVHGLVRSERGVADDERVSAGVTEAFVQYRPELSPGAILRLRAGTFFPPTSRENTGPLWSSPYTLTLSALNTWIAEEMRLTGVDTSLLLKTAGGQQLRLEGSLFGGADTLGSLIAWRGFGFSDRLSVLGEILPLPPLPSFARGAGFAGQRDDGTRPLDELDHRIGWQARARWENPQGSLLQVAYVDNRGDRALNRGQYAWGARFAQVGGEWHPVHHLTLVSEFAWGDTGMGPLTHAHVDLRFHVGYALASFTAGKARLSVRYDRFSNSDRDGTAEPDQESGEAITTALLWQVAPHLRLGAEALDLRAQRPAAAFSGANADTDARQLLLEARLTF